MRQAGKYTITLQDGRDPLPRYSQGIITHKELGMLSQDLQRLVGDAKASVTVSREISDKDYGSGISAHVSVSLSCNQDQATVVDAFNAAKELSGTMVEDAFNEAAESYTQNRGN